MKWTNDQVDSIQRLLNADTAEEQLAARRLVNEMFRTQQEVRTALRDLANCPFCDYVGPSPVLYERTVITGNDVVGLESFPYFVIEPLEPVTRGHFLVIPRHHTADFRSYPRLLGAMMQAAADLAGAHGLSVDYPTKFVMDRACNLIVSAGAEATQTVPHMHVHVVPRREGDGLMLPWSTP